MELLANNHGAISLPFGQNRENKINRIPNSSLYDGFEQLFRPRTIPC